MIIVTHTHTVTHSHTGTAKNVFRVELNKKSRYSVRIDSFYISELNKSKSEKEEKLGKVCLNDTQKNEKMENATKKKQIFQS